MVSNVASQWDMVYNELSCMCKIYTVKNVCEMWKPYNTLTKQPKHWSITHCEIFDKG